MEHVPWIKDFLVILAIAGVAVPVLHRFGIGQVLGFLLLGIVVGPFGLGRLTADFPWLAQLTLNDPARVAPFAELGVMALLFLIGLELSWGRLASLRRYVAGVGGTQFVASSIAIGAAAALLGAGTASIIIGLALAMSSTAVVMQLMETQGRTATPVGRIALSVLLFQDLMVAPVLFTAGFLGSGANRLSDLGWTVVTGISLVAGMLVAGRYVLGSVLRMAAQTGSRELIMAISLLVLVGFAMLTARAGLSAPLGAFLAGLLLSETEYRHQVEIDLSPFKGLLVGLFFISVGMNFDPLFLMKWLPHVMALAAALLFGKAVILWASARAFGVPSPVALETGLLLAQGGEFGFVAFGVAAASNLFSGELVQILTALVVLTMIATPILARLAGILSGKVADRSAAASRHLPDLAHIADHVVIGGFGRVGQTVARLLSEENIPFVALDMNATLVADQRAAGRDVYFGDASRPELLDRSGASRARAFVVTLDDAEAALRMVDGIRNFRADAIVYARALDPEQARKLMSHGAAGVVPETFEASLQLGGRLLESLGVSDDAVAQRLSHLRDELRCAIRKGG